MNTMTQAVCRLPLRYKGEPTDGGESKVWSESRIGDSWQMFLKFDVPKLSVQASADTTFSSMWSDLAEFIKNDLEKAVLKPFAHYTEDMLRECGTLELGEATELYGHVLYEGEKLDLSTPVKTLLPDAPAFLELKLVVIQRALPEKSIGCCSLM